VVANLDRLVVVVAIRQPDLDRGLLDRLLASAERYGIGAILCINKVDLAEQREIDPVKQVYERAGYAVIPASAETGTGIDALREALRGHRSAFMGPSGAGKSRLIGHLQPGLKVVTGSVSEKSGQGRHTTTRVDLHRTDFGALLADTPGVRDFASWKLEPTELRDLFPEFGTLQASCHFSVCTHVHEPDCAVRDGVESGAIDASRYKSYSAILAELQDGASASAGRGNREEGASGSTGRGSREDRASGSTGRGGRARKEWHS
jgi:ribosome biogenesis GTPase